MENKSLLSLLKRWSRLLMVGAVVGGLAGYYVASSSAPTYQAEVKALVGPLNTDFETQRAAGQLGRSYAELAVSRPVLAYAIRRSRARTTPRELIDEGAVKTASNDITRIVQITVRYGDARTAAALANTLAGRIQRLAAQTPKEAVDQTGSFMQQPEIARLSGVEQESVANALRRALNPPIGGTVTVVDPAEASADPVAPRVPLITILAAFMGLLAMAVVGLLRESSAHGVADERSLAELDSPAFLGAMVAPAARRKDGAPLAVERGATRVVERYRSLATKLGFFDDRHLLTSLLVLDTTDGRRGGAVAANLAAVLADAGRRVLLLDANGAPGGATSVLGLDGQPGYAELLSLALRGGELEGQADEFRVTRAMGFEVLPRGASTASAMVDVERANRLLEGIRADVDVVIISAAPIDRSPGGLVWARVASGTLLVVEDRRTTEDQLADVLRSLRFVDARVVGTVLGRAGRLVGKPPPEPSGLESPRIIA
jgi:Mrp family chromosome partitioning ATPase/capsular polysaccharide biosynthesis protein